MRDVPMRAGWSRGLRLGGMAGDLEICVRVGVSGL
jgi:hypothetical protein